MIFAYVQAFLLDHVCPSSLGPLSDVVRSSPGGGTINLEAEVFEGLCVCCLQKSEVYNHEPSLLGVHGYPLDESKTYLFQFSEGNLPFMARDFMPPYGHPRLNPYEDFQIFGAGRKF